MKGGWYRESHLDRGDFLGPSLWSPSFWRPRFLRLSSLYSSKEQFIWNCKLCPSYFVLVLRYDTLSVKALFHIQDWGKSARQESPCAWIVTICLCHCKDPHPSPLSNDWSFLAQMVGPTDQGHQTMILLERQYEPFPSVLIALLQNTLTREKQGAMPP